MPARKPLPSASLTNLQILRRMIGWGAVMALRWGWFPFLFGGELGFLEYLFPGINTPALKEPVQFDSSEWERNHDCENGFLLFMMCLTCICIIGGAITGIVVGYCAPADAPKNPFHSKFFMAVGKSIFWRWFWTLVPAFAFIELVLPQLLPYPAFGVKPQEYDRTTFRLVVASFLFVWNLWLGTSDGIRNREDETA